MIFAAQFRHVAWLVGLCAAVALAGQAVAGAPAPNPRHTPYARWARGPGNDPNYFPIAVWLQAPKNAPKFKGYGVHLYRIR